MALKLGRWHPSYAKSLSTLAANGKNQPQIHTLSTQQFVIQLSSVSQYLQLANLYKDSGTSVAGPVWSEPLFSLLVSFLNLSKSSEKLHLNFVIVLTVHPGCSIDIRADVLIPPFLPHV